MTKSDDCEERIDEPLPQEVCDCIEFLQDYPVLPKRQDAATMVCKQMKLFLQKHSEN